MNKFPRKNRLSAIVFLLSLPVAGMSHGQTNAQAGKSSESGGVIAGQAFKKDAVPEAMPRVVDFNGGWRFLRTDAPGAEQPAFDDGAWRQLDLPHDWSIEDLPPLPPVPQPSVTASNLSQTNHIRSGPFDNQSVGGYNTGWVVGGTGWYRKSFTLPDLSADRQVSLYFDGVYMDSDVWLNGRHLTNHPYGYTAFTCDLTPHLKHDGTNVIAVRVRNEGSNSRWYSGSGIYRPVQLIITGPVHVPTWGVFVTTPEVTAEQAKAVINVELVQNTGAAAVDATVTVSVHDPAGAIVATAKTTAEIQKDRVALAQLACAITKPQLWSCETPALYRAEVDIAVGGKTVDHTATTFGIRRVEIDAQNGLRLNGVPLKLKGGCMHHDNGILGSAAITRAEERRVELMKAAGFNAIRSSHNPPSIAFLDACDRLGMLVLDEAFDQWKAKKRPEDYHRFFNTWAESDIAAMVRRDRNHPSVIMWSIGNEIPERFSDTATAERLRKAVLSHDTTRPITAGVCERKGAGDWQKMSDPAFIHLDVAGINYFPEQYEPDHARHPERIMMCTESFPKDAFVYWSAVERLPYVIGDFVWTGFDYLGEAGLGRSWLSGEPRGLFATWPWHIAGSGDIDILGWRKPWSHYREALWRPGVLHVTVHQPLPAGKAEGVSAWGWKDVRSHWTWPDQTGKPLTVDVYSSCEQVTLMLNGRSLGTKPTTKAERHMATFTVPYEAGELKAVGTINGAKVESILRTAGAPAALRLTADRTRISNSRDDLAFIQVEVVDAAGIVVPQATNAVHMTVTGSGDLEAVGNGDPVDISGFRTATKNVWRGSLQAILRPKGKPGSMTLEASTEGLPPAKIVIETR